jgi:hypothetical protein
MLSGQRLVSLICGLCSDFSVFMCARQACAISDLRALLAGWLAEQHAKYFWRIVLPYEFRFS